jgi:hypothetical protein
MDWDFVRDQRGSTIEKIALIAGLLGVASLFFGSELEQLASEGGLPTIAFLSPDQYIVNKAKAPNFDSVDYMATGSIKAPENCANKTP